MKELRVVLADDSVLIQDHVKRFLLRIKGCNLVGVASDGNEALIMIQMLHPHVVLLDVAMPLKNGVEVLHEVRKRDSKVIVIMFTADSTPGLKQACLSAGANHFVCKTDFQELIDIFGELLKV